MARATAPSLRFRDYARLAAAPVLVVTPLVLVFVLAWYPTEMVTPVYSRFSHAVGVCGAVYGRAGCLKRRVIRADIVTRSSNNMPALRCDMSDRCDEASRRPWCDARSSTQSRRRQAPARRSKMNFLADVHCLRHDTPRAVEPLGEAHDTCTKTETIALKNRVPLGQSSQAHGC